MIQGGCTITGEDDTVELRFERSRGGDALVG